MKLYKILNEGETIESSRPGTLAGCLTMKVFGRLDCKSGERLMKKENRVFFHTLEDAVSEGYRPCKKCRPMDEDDFESMRHLIPEYATLQEFYDRDVKRR